ncbi:hypothetical protein PROFUN_04668 [Planoprotostelium fungivorum]|uniref:Uncharacterized protein n=1 Tax=Planoprotostelium fungivorum TaxID=1890364 RepID=A0A2P6NUJ8_9EUKA|nr:hypothetical protein PROFUN_04668 [Planoprotostelium fungivorum]
MGLFDFFSSSQSYDRIRDDDVGNPLHYLPPAEVSLDISWGQAKKMSSYSISFANHYACSLVAYAFSVFTANPFSPLMLIPFLLFPVLVSVCTSDTFLLLTLFQIISPFDEEIIPRMPQLLTLITGSLLGVLFHNIDNHILFIIAVVASLGLVVVQSTLYMTRMGNISCKDVVLNRVNDNHHVEALRGSPNCCRRRNVPQLVEFQG